MAEVKIAADSGGGSVGLVGPASTTSNAAVQFKLPVADGSANQHLKTDGSGQLGWVTEGVGGKILQVTGWTKTNTASSSTASGSESSQWMSHSITPSATSSKVLVLINASIGVSGGTQIALRLWIDGATPAAGTGNAGSAGNRRYVGSTGYINGCTGCIVTMPYSYLHSPSTTSAVTYGFTTLHSSGSTRTMYINRSHSYDDNTENHRAVSTITLMEVGA